MSEVDDTRKEREAEPQDFLISRGGPFMALQREMGLMSRTALRSERRAAIAVGLAAGVPLIVELIAGRPGVAFAMATDPAFVARFVVALAILFLMERSVDARLHSLLERFEGSSLLTAGSRSDLAAAIARALSLRNHGGGEAACLALALLVSVQMAGRVESTGAPVWAVAGADEGRYVLSAAGGWIVSVSSPLLWFLVLRWVWRYGVWAWLLSRIAALELRLVASHPDRSGGIAFLGGYPNAFAQLVFALSTIVAATAWNRLDGAELVATTYAQVLASWLAMVFGLFLLPLLAFVRPLSRLRDETLSLCARIETERERAAERRILGRNAALPDGPEPAEPAEADTEAMREAAAKLRTIPFSRAALLPLALAALAPLLFAGAALFPLAELLKIAKGLLIL